MIISGISVLTLHRCTKEAWRAEMRRREGEIHLGKREEKPESETGWCLARMENAPTNIPRISSGQFSAVTSGRRWPIKAPPCAPPEQSSAFRRAGKQTDAPQTKTGPKNDGFLLKVSQLTNTEAKMFAWAIIVIFAAHFNVVSGAFLYV